MAGGPSTPELAAAVSNAGGLGFVAAGYLSAEQLAHRIQRTRELTPKPFGVNLFVPGDGPSDPAAYTAYVEQLTAWAGDRPIGEPRYTDDDWDAKLALLEANPVAAVSFTFGCPDRALITAIRSTGAEAWATVTTPDEALQAANSGVDLLIAQGVEAGGHRGVFIDHPHLTQYGLLALLELIQEQTDIPLVASGGLGTRQAVEAVLAAGATAAQVGTSFLLAPEAGTSAPHRAAIASDRPTVLTRAFSGRLARGIRNAFTDTFPDAPIAYPEINSVTTAFRAQARQSGDGEVINLWAGEAHALAENLPAAEILQRLSPSSDVRPARR